MLVSSRPIPKVMVATTFVLGGCGGSDTDFTQLEVDVTATIGTAGGTVQEGGVRLVIPDGLFNGDTVVHIQTVPASTLPLALPPGLTAASAIFEVTVDQTLVFSKKALRRHAEPGEVVRLIHDRKPTV